MKTRQYINGSTRTVLEKQLDSAQDFVIRHIPRLYRLIMEKWPQTSQWFGYVLQRQNDDANKLTLLRRNKIIATNF